MKAIKRKTPETQDWPADNTERRDISTLIPYARNARTHSQTQILQLSASMREWGFTVPVLIDESGGIIAGHGRVMAAQLLGWTEVPVMVAVGWTEAQKRAYVLADNKLAMNSGWDDAQLAVELADLADLGFDLDLTGFALDEIAALTGKFETTDMPELPSGEKSPFQQMTFTLHDTQAEQVSLAIKAAASMGLYIDSSNENGNGNALARICETFLTYHVHS